MQRRRSKTGETSVSKLVKMINRKIAPEERGKWNFAFVADQVGWFEDYLSEFKIEFTEHFHIPLDLTEALDVSQFCLSVGINRYRDNANFLEVNHTNAFTLHFFRMNS